MAQQNGGGPNPCTSSINIEYSQYRHALLLGEADFSFARAFASGFKGDITATEYGNDSDVCARYHQKDNTRFVALVESMLSLDNLCDVVLSLNARLLGEEHCPCDRWNPATQKWDSGLFWQEHTFFDLVIFNFPHSPRHGKTSRLVRALFKQLRICVDDGRLPKNVIIEMRLIDKHERNVRAQYLHEEAAVESSFELVGTWPSDLETWQKFGYEHRMTRRNASCGRGLPCRVWRWRASI